MSIKKPKEKSGLETAIDQVLSEMQGFTADDKEYAQMVSQLQKLYKLRKIDKPDRIKLDTLIIVGGNLLGIILIVGHERAHVVTTKALILLRALR